MYLTVRRAMYALISAVVAVGAVGCSADSEAPPANDDQRVVTLVPALLDAALVVGVHPVAAAGVGEEFPDHLAGQVDGIALLDVTDGPNIEQVASFAPGRILTQAGTGNAADRLSGIAPTTQIDFPVPAANWPDYVAQAAAALGRSDRLAEVRAAHDERIADAAQQVQSAMAGKTVTILRVSEDGSFRVYGPESFPGSILTSMGLTLHTFTGGEPDAQGYIDASAELLPEAIGDVVITMQVDGEAEQILGTNPVWPQLPAVTAGRAFFVDQASWLHIGYQSATAVIDDAVRQLGSTG